MTIEERVKKLEDKLELIIEKMKLEDDLLKLIYSQVKIHSEYLQSKDADECGARS